MLNLDMMVHILVGLIVYLDIVVIMILSMMVIVTSENNEFINKIMNRLIDLIFKTE